MLKDAAIATRLPKNSLSDWLLRPFIWLIWGISGPFLLALFWLLKLSCRWEILGREHLQASPVFLYCGWHEQFFNYGVACAPLARDQRMTMVMGDFWYSRHLAWVVGKMGAAILFVPQRPKPKPGEPPAATPAAKSPTMELILNRLAQGWSVAILPDGPHGPRRVIKNGVFTIAERSGVPILPIRAIAHRPYIVPGTWDKKRFPLPFSRVTVEYLPPIWVRPGSIDAAKVALQAALDYALD